MNFNPKRPKQIWRPGATPYKDFLDGLTPEQRAEHLKQRAQRKAMKKVMKQVTEEFTNEWTAELHNAAWNVLMKARDKSDPIAFAAVWDRVVGKPKVDDDSFVDPERPLPFKDEDLE